MDNVRNLVGNPLAGVDPDELVDTRPYCKEFTDKLTNNGAAPSYIHIYIYTYVNINIHIHIYIYMRIYRYRCRCIHTDIDG